MNKGSVAYRQVVKFKIISSTKEKLNNHLEQSKQCLVYRGYREDRVFSEIERIKFVQRTVSFQIRDKEVDYSITLALTYRPALNQLYEILRRALKHVLKSQRPTITTRGSFSKSKNN